MPWGVVATAAVAAYGSYEDQKDKEDARKENKELSELGFNRQNWLDQQQHKWGLEKRQYVEDSIAGFRQYAPESATNFGGKPFQTPERTSTAGLAAFDPNTEGAIQYGLTDEDFKPKPLMGGV